MAAVAVEAVEWRFARGGGRTGAVGGAVPCGLMGVCRFSWADGHVGGARGGA